MISLMLYHRQGSSDRSTVKVRLIRFVKKIEDKVTVVSYDAMFTADDQSYGEWFEPFLTEVSYFGYWAELI